MNFEGEMCLLEREQNLPALLRRPAARRLQEPPVSSAHGELHPLKSRRVRCRSLLSGSGVPKAGLARFRAPGEPNIYYRNKAVQIDPSISFSLTCLEHLLRDQARAGSIEGTDDRQDEVLLLGAPQPKGALKRCTQSASHPYREADASRREQASPGRVPTASRRRGHLPRMSGDFSAEGGRWSQRGTPASPPARPTLWPE